MMKKVLVLLIVFGFFGMPVFAHRHHHHSHAYDYNRYHSSSESHPVYLINSEYIKTEQKIPDCTEHYLEIATTINTYSDGTQRTFSNITIFNSDGSVLISDCTVAKHITSDKKHYFIVKRLREPYKIIDGKGQILTHKNYTQMDEVDENRILVKYDKKYGIIDVFEDTIVPIKYQKFQQVNPNVYLTKLNGYWGAIDINNNELIKNNCNKITPLYDTLIIKRYGKYGLANLYGYIFIEPEYDSIKKFHEYIIIKKDKKYGLLDFEGKKITEIKYKKFRLNHNDIEGQYSNGSWKKINYNSSKAAIFMSL